MNPATQDEMVDIQAKIDELNDSMEDGGFFFLTCETVTIADFLIFGHLTDLLALRKDFNQYQRVTDFYTSMFSLDCVQELYGSDSTWKKVICPRADHVLSVLNLADYELGGDSPGFPQFEGLQNEVQDLKAQIFNLTGVEVGSNETSLAKLNSY